MDILELQQLEVLKPAEEQLLQNLNDIMGEMNNFISNVKTIAENQLRQVDDKYPGNTDQIEDKGGLAKDIAMVKQIKGLLSLVDEASTAQYAENILERLEELQYTNLPTRL
jgi:hypothetical protein